MPKPLRDYATCWVRHEPELEVGKIELSPSELIDVSIEIRRASRSDSEASISLVERFCAAAINGSDIDERLLRYIAKALQVLVKDKNDISGFARTLGIRSTGRPKINQERDRKIYFAVREYMRNGMTYENACGLVADDNCLSQSTVEGIYQEEKKMHLKFLREMDAYSSEVTNDDWTAIRGLLEKEQSLD